MWQKIQFSRPTTHESLRKILDDTVAGNEPLERLISLARIIVVAQEMDSPLNHIGAAMALRYTIGEILREGNAVSLLELLKQSCLERDREAFKELLAAVQVDAIDCKDRELSATLLDAIGQRQAELHQQEAADTGGAKNVKQLQKEMAGNTAFTHQLRRAKAKMRSFDRTLCEDAIEAAFHLAEQEADPWHRAKKLFWAAQTAKECERGYMALDCANAAMQVCQNQIEKKTASMPSLNIAAFERRSHAASNRRLLPPKKPVQPKEGQFEELGSLISQFITELQADLENSK